MCRFACIILSKTGSDVLNPKTRINIIASLHKADDNPEEIKRIIYNSNLSTQKLVKRTKARLKDKIKK
jgi:predicted transcriptional regulator